MLGTAPVSTARLHAQEAIAGYKAQQDWCAKANHSTLNNLSFGNCGCADVG